MANVANVKVKPGNVLELSGSSVVISGSSVATTGNLFVNGTISASVLTISETVVSSSVVHHSGNTKFGDQGDGPFMDVHQFTGSVNISGSQHSITGPLNIVGNVSGTTFTGSFSGNGSQLTNLNLSGSAVTSLLAGDNITVSSTTGSVTVALTSSITGGLTNLTASNISASNLLKATTLSASAAEFSGSVLIYGTASLSANPDAAYVRYTGLPEDKILIYPGLKVSGSTVVSGNLNVTGSVSASSFTGSGAGLTNLPAANLTGIVPLANGGTGIDASGVTSGKLLIGSGSALAIGDLVAGTNVAITPGSGSITIAVTGNLGVSQVTGGANISASIAGNSLTVALSQSVTGLTNLDSAVITGSEVLVTGSLKVSGSLSLNTINAYDASTSPWIISDADVVILVPAIDGDDPNPTILISDAATQPNGRTLIIKRTDAADRTVSITVSGSACNIDDSPTFELNGPYQSITLVASVNYGQWFVV